ncbi:putative internal (core) protein [Escherichia phage Ro45lw]|uniref:Internal (Core) protein n=1 Tax=Escherichia phage Ro45lw TaxID=2498616 RepID=A0A3S9URX1_9CAUD|nr:internal virion protein [Escherichia phage Ro45lw]AZS13026.1 putative internal (core) protein [Escherichia phage Ro45lw]
MYIRKATEQDVLSFEIAIDDVNELMANDPRRDLESVLLSHLTPSSVVLVDALGTVYAYGGNQGDNVWFVTSRLVSRLTRAERREFVQRIAEYRDLRLDQYPVLWNYVWEGNSSHIRFLKILGAVFHEEWTESPVTGERFRLFTMSRSNNESMRKVRGAEG